MNEDELADLLAGRTPAAAQDTGAQDTSDDRVQSLRQLLADEATWVEPAPWGADALVAAIHAADGPASESGPGQAERRRMVRRHPTLLGAAAALVLLVVVGAAGLLWFGDDAGKDVAEPHRQELALAGTDLAPGASASATVVEWRSGVAFELDITGLPPAEPGSYYQGWVRGAEGAVTIGTFHMRGGDGPVELWSGVPLDSYPDLTVTLQVEGEGPESSGEVVLEGKVVDPGGPS